MALEKVLHKIQIHVKELTSTLELFVDDSVQPSVNDCETLQHQLNELQECLAIYKYQKKEKEISPSFSIHAKVSEINTSNIKPPDKQIKEEKQEEVKDSIKTEHVDVPVSNLPPLTVGINDKFRFINELFKQNNHEYGIAMEQINSLRSWAEADLYLRSLKDLYGWKENEEVVQYFYALVKKRYA